MKLQKGKLRKIARILNNAPDNILMYVNGKETPVSKVHATIDEDIMHVFGQTAAGKVNIATTCDEDYFSVERVNGTYIVVIYITVPINARLDVFTKNPTYVLYWNKKRRYKI